MREGEREGDIGQCDFGLDRECGGLGGPHTKHPSMVWQSKKEKTHEGRASVFRGLHGWSGLGEPDR